MLLPNQSYKLVNIKHVIINSSMLTFNGKKFQILARKIICLEVIG